MYSDKIEGLFGSLKISASGLAAQRRRLNNIAENLANINTTRTSEGGPYQRKITIITEINRKTRFWKSLAKARLEVTTPRIGHRGVESQGDERNFSGVQATDVRDGSPPILKYDPTHPDADQFGYVKMPNINIVKEMTNMITAQRAYEANVTVIKATKDMARKALEI
ncbi:flagellar basal body rod protein FlgC [bacterium]|nr:flagellar basal body rod protein FlgC [bacterium]